MLVIVYTLSIRNLEKFTAAQPFEVEFKTDGVVVNVRNVFVLLLTYKLVGGSSVGPKTS